MVTGTLDVLVGCGIASIKTDCKSIRCPTFSTRLESRKDLPVVNIVGCEVELSLLINVASSAVQLRASRNAAISA